MIDISTGCDHVTYKWNKKSLCNDIYINGYLVGSTHRLPANDETMEIMGDYLTKFIKKNYPPLWKNPLRYFGLLNKTYNI
jgi:hypothetical protein